MDKQELIKQVKALKNIFGNKTKYVEKNTVIELISKLDEPQKPVVPQFVADWIEYCKRHNFTLFGCLDPVDNFEVLVGEDFEGDARKCILWCRSASDKVARAWLDGYTVEEKRYRVKMKNAYYNKYPQFLCETDNGIFWAAEIDLRKTKFTRKDLEQAGFGWVFDCEGIEIEEVEE